MGCEVEEEGKGVKERGCGIEVWATVGQKKMLRWEEQREVYRACPHTPRHPRQEARHQ